MLTVFQATGQIGHVFTEYLLKSGKQIITALTRSGSHTTLPKGVRNASIDYNDEATLVTALTGQDFLVITLALSAPSDTHSKLVRAAAKAGVPYIMPNAYGVDIYGKSKLQGDIPALRYIHANVSEIADVGASWIALTPNFWYEYSMGAGPFTFGFDFKNRHITFYDDGKTRINTTTWPQIGRALAALVNLKRLPEDENDNSITLAQFCNKPVYISSFTLSQREMLDSVNNLLGTNDQDWKLSYQPTAQRYKEGFKELSEGDRTGFLKGMYARVFYATGDGVFETHNDVLGLPQEDLAEATLAAHQWGITQEKAVGK